MSRDRIWKIWLFVWLIWWAVKDLRRREIAAGPVYLVLTVGIGLTLIHSWQRQDISVCTEAAVGSILGLGLWVCSYLSKEKIGRGDALVILCLGIYLGLPVSFAVLMMALTLASIASCYLLVIRKKPARYTIPFLPYLLLSYVMGLVSNMI